MENAATFHKRALVKLMIDRMTSLSLLQTSFELHLWMTLQQEGPIVLWTIWALSLWYQGDGCHIPSLLKNPSFEEVLYCSDHISTYNCYDAL